KPQSMQATAPSLSVEPHAGHLVAPAPGLKLTLSPSEIDGELGGVALGVLAAAGTWNGCLHVGHCTRLPAALSGTCICLPHAALGHRMITGITNSGQGSVASGQWPKPKR